MELFTHRFHSGRRISGIRFAIGAGTAFACVFAGFSEAQSVYRRSPAEKVIVESGAASQVIEKVRALAPGVLMEVFVKVGDPVKKGQILGHTELAPTKLQLDLARLTIENSSKIKALEGQADAWTATREEAEEALRKRRVEKSRLEWATGMEKFFRGNYEAQLEQKKIERIQFEYWKQQYESRFFRAPTDGLVAEVLLDVGKPVSYATHVFTIGDEDSYLIPVSVPAEFINEISASGSLPIRTAKAGYVTTGLVDSIADDPKSPGKKIVKLRIHESDFPSDISSNLTGRKFDVLLPQAERKTPASG
jgi:multidrug efflux pump subunit AcrA (membrane-fusion protein)